MQHMLYIIQIFQLALINTLFQSNEIIIWQHTFVHEADITVEISSSRRCACVDKRILTVDSQQETP